MIFCFANLRPGRRWRKGLGLECESQGLSAVIQAEGPNSEENELQIDVYSQKEEFEAWMWLQPLCRQLTEINNTLSLKAEVFVLAKNDDEEKWFSLDSVWHWKKRGVSDLQGEKSLFPIQSLMDLIYGRYLPNVEKKLMEKQGVLQRIFPTANSQIAAVEVAKLTGLDLSKPFEKQSEKIQCLVDELKRSNDMHERQMTILQVHTSVVEKNTEAIRDNTWTLQQSNTRLYDLRDGKVQFPPKIMKALAKAFRQSDEPVLRVTGQKMKWHFWKDKGQQLRELLADAANLAAVGPILVELGKEYGPTLLKLIASITLV